MKLSIEGISSKSDWSKIGIKLPEYDVKKLYHNTKEHPRWVHFGVGNIFRIFIGNLADRLIEEKYMDTGINCVECFDGEIIEKIYEPFDNLVLGVTIDKNGNYSSKVIGSLGEAIYRDYERLKVIFENRELQMVSFTITEKGYELKDGNGEFLSYIKNDIENSPKDATSAIGVLCGALYHRYRSSIIHPAPIALVSMDNCSHNGDKLFTAVSTFAEEWVKRGFVSRGFLEYVKDETKVSFPLTMIDKITPRPDGEVSRYLTGAGVENMKIVVTEKNTFIAPFVNAEVSQYLVIEDDFPNGRPKLEKVEVYMTDRETVNAVEKMKVTTCLNPLHTALAVYGCLLGYTSIAKEMEDEELNRLVKLLGEEGMKVVVDPKIISASEFLKEVIEQRLPNPYIPDTPQRIATDTSSKLAVRFGETLKSYMSKYRSNEEKCIANNEDNGKVEYNKEHSEEYLECEEYNVQDLVAIPLVIAGWLRYLLGVDDEGKEFQISSDARAEKTVERLRGVSCEGELTDSMTAHIRDVLKPILSDEELFGVDLYKAGIGKKVEDIYIEEIGGKGAVRRSLKKYL